MTHSGKSFLWKKDHCWRALLTIHKSTAEIIKRVLKWGTFVKDAFNWNVTRIVFRTIKSINGFLKILNSPQAVEKSCTRFLHNAFKTDCKLCSLPFALGPIPSTWELAAAAPARQVRGRGPCLRLRGKRKANASQHRPPGWQGPLDGAVRPHI